MLLSYASSFKFQIFLSSVKDQLSVELIPKCMFLLKEWGDLVSIFHQIRCIACFQYLILPHGCVWDCPIRGFIVVIVYRKWETNVGGPQLCNPIHCRSLFCNEIYLLSRCFFLSQGSIGNGLLPHRGRGKVCIYPNLPKRTPVGLHCACCCCCCYLSIVPCY